MFSPRIKRTDATKSRSLVGSFEENILSNRLNPIRTVDGYTAEVRASCKNFQPSPLKSGVRVSFFSAGDCFPYLGQVPIGQHGYKIPKKGTLQVTLFNPNRTIVKLFVLLYDLTDMPPNSQTFLRQKTLFLPIDNGNDHPTSASNEALILKNKIGQHQKNRSEKCRVRYLIQLNIVSSKSGRIYLNKDLRIFISKKVDLETASQIKKQDYELKAIDEMPSNPRYFAR